MDPLERAKQFKVAYEALCKQIGSVIVGQDKLIEGVLCGIFAGGHCLLEGVPGLGKTQLIRTLAQVFDLKYSRIQFTPDLMPADVIGTNIITEDENGRRSYTFRQGPIFANMVLADEINRATPKTQSGMLEAMQERSVTVWGETYKLAPPMFVLATQNPIEMEGTYPLPEAQLDRFLLKLIVNMPSREELVEIVARTTGSETAAPESVMNGEELVGWQATVANVVAAPHVLDYAARLVLATHPEQPNAIESVRDHVRHGASPRAAQALALAGKFHALLDARLNLSFRDIRTAALSVFRHRILLTYQAQADNVTPESIVGQILENTSETVED